jgi:hypothetical protein
MRHSVAPLRVGQVRRYLSLEDLRNGYSLVLALHFFRLRASRRHGVRDLLDKVRQKVCRTIGDSGGGIRACRAEQFDVDNDRP